MTNPARFEGLEKLKRWRTAREIDSNILSLLPFDEKELRQAGLFVFGAGRLGQKISKFLKRNGFRVNAFIDNSRALHGTVLDDLPIHPAQSLKENSVVYIASETFLNPIQRQLRLSGITRTMSHLQGSIFFKTFKGFPTDLYLQNLTEDLIEHKEKYLAVFSKLNDETSRVVFDNLIQYRLTGNLQYIDRVALPSAREYFDPSVLQVSASEVFFDGGGFDGDSAMGFVNFCGNLYRSIHIFEPDPGLLQKARERLSGFHNVFFNELGVYSKTTSINFDTTGGLDGSIQSSGNTAIRATALDEYDSVDAPTYIKLDIEGAELEAIAGAQQTIKRHHPKLAIASYHLPRHLWEVPLSLLNLNPRYEVCLRHYTNYLLGSTYYFLPSYITS